MDKPLANLRPALYAPRIHEIQAIARAHGYAVAIHGSMQRDLDVVAVPWTDKATLGDDLVQALCDRMPCTLGPNSPTERPHGRMSYTLLMVGSLFMDLSVMPRVTVARQHALSEKSE